MALRSLHKAFALNSPGTQSNFRLRYMIPSAERVTLGIKKCQNTLFLVIM